MNPGDGLDGLDGLDEKDGLDERDGELAEALKGALTVGSEDEFARRVVAAAENAGLFAPTEWWEVLGEWARPGLVAVAASLVLLVGATLVTPRPEPGVTTLGVNLIVAGEAAELAAPVPPDPERMMAIAFTTTSR